MQHLHRDAGQTVDFYLDNAVREDVATYVARLKFRVRSIWLLALFSAFTLLFFSISTNQEYYTFPAWTPLLILIAGVLAGIEEESRFRQRAEAAALSTSWLTGAQAVFAVVGVLAAIALGWGLWTSRNLPFVPDIGTLLAHRDVGDYTLSMSHFFDLTGPSFAALRLPAVLAAITLLIGPARRLGAAPARGNTWPLPSAWRSPPRSSSSPRTSPSRASSPCSAPKQLADTIIGKGSPSDTFIIYGDQSDASSVIFYTHDFLRKPSLHRCRAMLASTATARRCSGAPAIPTRPESSSAKTSFQRCGEPASANGSSPRTPINPKSNSCSPVASTRSKPSPTKQLWTDRPLN